MEVTMFDVRYDVKNGLNVQSPRPNAFSYPIFPLSSQWHAELGRVYDRLLITCQTRSYVRIELLKIGGQRGDLTSIACY